MTLMNDDGTTLRRRRSHIASQLSLYRPIYLCNQNALVIKKRGEPSATARTLQIAEYLAREHGMRTFVEPAAAGEFEHLPSVTTLAPPVQTEQEGWDVGRHADAPSDVVAEVSAASPAQAATPVTASNWQSQIDLAIAIGGDGTLLYLSSLFPRRCPPVVPFHSGSLGFLMAFDPKDYADVLNVCLRGEQPVVSRNRLEFCVRTEEEWARENGPAPDTRWFHLMNETVIKRQHRLSGWSEIEVYVDDDLLARYKGDGLVIASPTGSTAYSMAAGGSIVHPEIDALLITPLNSSSLASRPLLLPGSALVRLHVRSESMYLEGKYGRFISGALIHRACLLVFLCGFVLRNYC
jgi:NAD kinase